MAPLGGASSLGGFQKEMGSALAVIVVPAIGRRGVVAIALAIAAVLAHEAVKLFTILGLAQVRHIVLERIDFGIEASAFFVETTKLVGAVVVEGCIARGRIVTAKAGKMLLVRAHKA